MHYYCKRLLEDICYEPCARIPEMEITYLKLLKVSNNVPSELFSTLEVKRCADDAKVQWFSVTQSFMLNFKRKDKFLRLALLFSISREIMKLYNTKDSDIAMLVPYWLDDFLICL